MTRTERVFHMVLFEALALVLLTVFAVIFTDENALAMGGLAITLSLIAMVWNYAYNLLFDNLFPGDRLARTKRLRLAHGAVFELGMILLSFPVIMWFLELDLMTVLIMDLGFVTFFFVYAIVFNWSYDVLRVRFVPSS